MSSLSLDKLSLAELLALDAEIKVHLLRSHLAARAAFKTRLENLIAEYAFSPEDVADICGFQIKSANSKRAPALVKFANPDNAAQTWTGRGRQPRWLTTLTAQGRSLEDFRL
jgi:DNA-binding protein H-NS